MKGGSNLAKCTEIRKPTREKKRERERGRTYTVRKGTKGGKERAN